MEINEGTDRIDNVLLLPRFRDTGLVYTIMLRLDVYYRAFGLVLETSVRRYFQS